MYARPQFLLPIYKETMRDTVRKEECSDFDRLCDVTLCGRNLSCMWLSVQLWMSNMCRNETRQIMRQGTFSLNPAGKRLEIPFATLIMAEKRQVSWQTTFARVSR